MKVYRGRAEQIVIGAYDYFAEVWTGGNPTDAFGKTGTWKELDMRFDLFLHSPDGPCWGYTGSGPQQLALALLADALGDDDVAKENYQEFCRSIVSSWDQFTNWQITEDDIIRILIEQPWRNE